MSKKKPGAIIIKSKNPVIVSTIKNKPTGGVILPQLSYEEYLTSDNLELLKDLKYSNGNPIIDLQTKGNTILYEILYRIKNQGFDKVYSHLKKQWKDEYELYYSFEEFNIAKYDYNNFIDDYFVEKEVVEGLVKCTRCKGKKTLISLTQTRARDEGEKISYYCTDCGHKWYD